MYVHTLKVFEIYVTDIATVLTQCLYPSIPPLIVFGVGNYVLHTKINDVRKDMRVDSAGLRKDVGFLRQDVGFMRKDIELTRKATGLIRKDIKLIRKDVSALVNRQLIAANKEIERLD